MSEFTRPYLVGQDPDEFPDTKLTGERRLYLKNLGTWVADCYSLNAHDLMFLAGALEEVARRKRDSMRSSES